MKLIIVLAVIAYSNGDKLDRRYLPPSSANTAGGSPGSIQAPFETQKDQAGGNFGLSHTPFEGQRSTQAPNQIQYPSYEEGQNKPQTQPGFTGQDGTSTQQSRVDIQRPRLPGSGSQPETYSQTGSGLQKVPGQQFERPSQNDNERQSDYQKPVGSALQNYPSSSQMSSGPDYTRPQKSSLEQLGFRPSENVVPQNLPVGQQVNPPSFSTNEEEIKRPFGNSESYAGDVQKPGFSRNEQISVRQPSLNQNYDNAPQSITQGFSGQGSSDEQSPSGPFRGQNADNSRTDVRPERLQAAQDRTAEILRYENENDGETFAYNFETSNGINAEEHGIATNGVQAEGAFSYIGDDGQSYSVTYTADENGYQPQGAHLPTPHPIPDVILKSIERNAQAAANARKEGNQFNGNDVPTRSQQHNAEPQEYSDGTGSQQPYDTQSGPQNYNDGLSQPQFGLNQKLQQYNPQSGPQAYNSGSSQPKSVPTPSQQQYNPQLESQIYNTGFSQPQSSLTPKQQEFRKPQPYNLQSGPQAYNTGSSQPKSVPSPIQQQYTPQSESQIYNTGFSQPQSSSTPKQQEFQKPQPYNSQSGPQAYTGSSQAKSVLTPSQQQYNPQSGSSTYNTGLSQPQFISTSEQQEYKTQSEPRTYNTGSSQPVQHTDTSPKFNQYNVPLPQKQFSAPSPSQSYPSGPQNVSPSFAKPINEVSSNLPSIGSDCSDPRSCHRTDSQYNANSQPKQFTEPAQSSQPESTPSSGSIRRPPLRGNQQISSGIQQNQGSPQATGSFRSSPKSTNQQQYSVTPRENLPSLASQQRPNQGSTVNSFGQYKSPVESTNIRAGSGPSQAKAESLPISISQESISGPYNYPVPSQFGQKTAFGINKNGNLRKNTSPLQGRVPNQERGSDIDYNQLRPDGFQTAVQEPDHYKRGPLSDTKPFDSQEPESSSPDLKNQNNQGGSAPYPNQFNILPSKPSNNQYYQDDSNFRPSQSTIFPVAPASNQQSFEQRQKPQGFSQPQNNIGITAQAPYRVNQQPISNTKDNQKKDSRFPSFGSVLVPSNNLKPNIEDEQNIQAPQNIPSSQIGTETQAPSGGNLAQIPSHQFSDENEIRGDTRFPPYSPVISPNDYTKPEKGNNQNTISPKYGQSQQQIMPSTQFSNTPRQEQQNINAPQFSSPNQDISRPTEENGGSVRKPFESQSGMKALQAKPSDAAYNAQGYQNQPSRSQQYKTSGQQSGAPDSNQNQDADKYPDAPYSYDTPQSGASSVGGKPGQFPSRGQIRFTNSGPKTEEQFPSSRQPPSFSAQEGYKY